MMKTIDTSISSSGARNTANRRLNVNNSGPVRAGITLAILATTLVMTGCANYSRDHFTVGSVPDDYRTRHPIVVSESETAQDLVIPRNLRQLSLRDRDVVRGMGLSFRRSGAKSIAVLIPAGSPNEQAARRAASQAVNELVATGIGPAQIAVHHYDASGYGDNATLRVVYTDLVANVASECGKWEEDLTDTKENVNYANFGCAYQNNLARMIANPADLLSPRAMSDIDSTKRTLVIEDWRTTTTELGDISG